MNQQEQLDNKLSELRQQIWIELWALDDASAILDNVSTDNLVVIASLKSGNTLKLLYDEEIKSEVTPLFLETLRQEFVNAKIIESDYSELTDKVDNALQQIRDEILTDYQTWKGKVNKLIDTLNDTSMVLNEQVNRNE